MMTWSGRVDGVARVFTALIRATMRSGSQIEDLALPRRPTGAPSTARFIMLRF